MYRFFKRFTDLAGVAGAIVVTLPAMGVIWVVIRLGSKGPGVFKQERAGFKGEPFTLYKFRTMRTDVDPFGPSPKGDCDPRLTKIGVFLREYSLDELPQLFNVLWGQMSLVGPRPLYVAQMAEWNERERTRLDVKPGLTGLAQISGRGQLTREEKLELDAQYVERASFWLDMVIICKTIGQIFRKQDIYEKNYSKTEQTRGQDENC